MNRRALAKGTMQAARQTRTQSLNRLAVADYLFRWLELRFLKGEQGLLFELHKPSQPQREVTSVVEGLGQIVELGDAPVCQSCGSLMVTNGSCYRCIEWGSTSGCS